MPKMTKDEQQSFEAQFERCAEHKSNGPIVVSKTLSFVLIWREGKVSCLQNPPDMTDVVPEFPPELPF